MWKQWRTTLDEGAERQNRTAAEETARALPERKRGGQRPAPKPLTADQKIVALNGRNVGKVVAVATQNMGEHAVRDLRAAAVETFRRAKVEGWNDNEIQKHLQEAWDEKAGDTETHRFVDARGRSWSNAAYLQMLTRTTLAKVDRNAQINTLTGNGYDLARISDDGGGDECDACARWSGKIVSLTGATRGFPTLADAEADGLFHPNCVHRIEYLDEDEIEAALREAGQEREDEDGDEPVADENGETEAEESEETPPQAWTPSTPLERATDALMQTIGAQHTDVPLPLSGVNPHYADAPAYRNNCQRCVVAAEARARGYDVEAKPTDGNQNGVRFWKDSMRDWQFCGGGRKFRKDAEKIIGQVEDGARFLVRIKWPGGKRSPAHFFLAVKENGEIRYEDPQNPERDASRFFDSASTVRGQNWILRIDNREFTDEVVDALEIR